VQRFYAIQYYVHAVDLESGTDRFLEFFSWIYILHFTGIPSFLVPAIANNSIVNSLTIGQG